MDFLSKKSLRNKKWHLVEQDNFSENIISRILNNRKIENSELFLKKSLKDFWPKVDDMDDLQKAIDIIIEVIKQKKKIGIVGDYDVDGSTATSLLILFFQKIDINFVYKIPNRFVDGYGVSSKILQDFFHQNVDLVITVDNGTSAFEAMNYCKENNKQVIVLDHHNLQGEINVDALVNPQRRQDNNLQYLCAAGVVFVFLVELNKQLFDLKIINNKIDMYQYIDMVANATICDVMPLVGLNRCLVAEGLKKALSNPIPGFKLLLEKHSYIDTETMGFYLGPYINAPGRLGDSNRAIDLMTETDEQKLKKIVIDLVSLNLERREIESQITEEALLMNSDEEVLCVYSDKWHEGVIGIVAGRLKEKFQKPVFVFKKYESSYKGSARSIPGFHVGNCIKEALKEKLAIVGGGHEMAGGVTVENIDLFQNFVLEYYKKNAKIENPIRNIEECISLSAVNKETHEQLDKLGPFGPNNSKPIFLFANCYIEDYKVISNKHCIFTIRSGVLQKKIRSIVFNIADDPIEKLRSHKGNVHIIATISRSNAYIQLSIEDAILD